MKERFELGFLDHVAIRVIDLDKSAKWYSDVLGLVKHQKPEWGEYPIFLVKKNFGIALFPAHTSDEKFNPESRNVKIDHFAFNISNDNFDKAISYFYSLNLKFKIQDHHYFKSIYLKDPDGHTVELTTAIQGKNAFE